MGKKSDKKLKKTEAPSDIAEAPSVPSDDGSEVLFTETAEVPDVTAAADAAEGDDAGRAKHAKDMDAEFPEYMKRARKMRKTLTIVIIVLVVLLIAVGVLIFLLFNASNNAASQQTQVYMEERDTAAQDKADNDAVAVTEKQTAVPNLIGLFGKDLDGSIEYLEHGAQVAGTTNVNEEGSAIKQEVRVILSDETADSRNGAPTVYLGMNADGKVVRAGYSVATSSLGYGAISFTDAVQNEAIIENTLEEVGLKVEDGTAKLPEDKSAYSTYATDGKLTRESFTFAGTGKASDKQYKWSSTLTYDYTMANTTDNLAETIRTIYVYIEQ